MKIYNLYFVYFIYLLNKIECFEEEDEEEIEMYQKRQALTLFDNYHIKWVTTEPILPIFLRKKISDGQEYRWYKHSANLFMDEIPEYENKFFYSETNDETLLHILDYDKQTHEQLSSYEPRLSENLYESPSETDLFTLVYLKSHSIDVIKSDNDLSVYCNVTFLLPNNNKIINNNNINLIEKFLKLKIGFSNQQENNFKNNIKRQNTTNRIDLNLNKNKRSINPTTVIQINLDIGPIILPKTQFFDKNNLKENNITCKLDLYEQDLEPDQTENEIIHQSVLHRAIDTYDPMFNPKQILPEPEPEPNKEEQQVPNEPLSNKLDQKQTTSSKSLVQKINSSGRIFVKSSYYSNCLILFFIFFIVFK